MIDMETIRKVKGYELNYNHMQRLCNVSYRDKVSFWFNEDDKNDMLKLDDASFVKRCKELIRVAN